MYSRPSDLKTSTMKSEPGRSEVRMSSAGGAISRRGRREALNPGRLPAIAKVLEMQFAAVAEYDEASPGQNLYQEYRRNAGLLQSSFIPEEDLQFIDGTRQRPS